MTYFKIIINSKRPLISESIFLLKYAQVHFFIKGYFFTFFFIDDGFPTQYSNTNFEYNYVYFINTYFNNNFIKYMSKQNKVTIIKLFINKKLKLFNKQNVTEPRFSKIIILSQDVFLYYFLDTRNN